MLDLSLCLITIYLLPIWKMQRRGRKQGVGKKSGEECKAFFGQALATWPVANSSFPLPGSKPYIYDSIAIQ